MRYLERGIYIVSFLLMLNLLCSCDSSDGSDAYMQSLSNNTDNLNMKGEPLKATSPEDMARVQADLQYLGYDPGPVDGSYGPQTKRAIKRFQREHGIYADGAAGPLTETSIRKVAYAREALKSTPPKSTESR